MIKAQDGCLYRKVSSEVVTLLLTFHVECGMRNLQCLPEGTTLLYSLASGEAKGAIITGKLAKYLCLCTNIPKLTKLTPMCALSSQFWGSSKEKASSVPQHLLYFDCHAAVYARAVSYKCSLSIQKENTQFCNGLQNPVFKKHLSIYTVCFFWQFPMTIVL